MSDCPKPRAWDVILNQLTRVHNVVDDVASTSSPLPLVVDDVASTGSRHLCHVTGLLPRWHPYPIIRC